MDEASLHEQNCFVTLTYNDDHLPDLGSLEYRAFQLFMKRLRKKFTHGLPSRKHQGPTKATSIRFFMAGEYGDLKDRPHFHACLFGINFDDRTYFKTTPTGARLYVSDTLNALWSDKNGPIGHATIGDITFESAAYTARYIMKKVNGHENWNYAKPDRETGEINYIDKEFCHMSLKPGIGHGFMQKWKTDIFPRDYCVINGKQVKPPKYYTLLLKKTDPAMHSDVIDNREASAIQKQLDNTEERLLVKEKVLKARLSFLKRQ